MAFENITEIEVIGRPSIKVPESMTAEQVMRAMSIDPSTHEQTVNGTRLILSAASGSKGLLEVTVLEDGAVVPKGNPTFPTDQDIQVIHSLFPADNLFETLNDPTKLAEYVQAIKENQEALLEARDGELLSEREEAFVKLEEALAAIKPYVLNQDSVNGAIAYVDMVSFQEKLLVLKESAAAEVADLLYEKAVREQKEELLQASLGE